MKIRTVLYLIIGVPVFLSLAWLFVIPTNLIQERIEDAIASSGNGELSLSVTGLRKGIFLNLSADNLTLVLDQKPALEISDFRMNISPRHLPDFQLAFAINGEMGGGKVHGTLKLPLDGTIYIEQAELNDIPYLKRVGIDIYGKMSSEISVKGDSVNAVFRIPDLNIGDSAITVIPLINSFRKMQGSLSLAGNNLKVDSVSLDGDKGYARLKGTITNGIMDLSLEMMPETRKLNTMESMLIGKYIISPGYYVVPIKGRLP
jgi:type II secretion system protein N